MVKKRNGELLLKGYRISVLDMDGDNGSTTTCIYLIPLNCTLKMIKMMNFMLCVFHQFFFKSSLSSCLLSLILRFDLRIHWKSLMTQHYKKYILVPTFISFHFLIGQRYHPHICPN